MRIKVSTYYIQPLCRTKMFPHKLKNSCVGEPLLRWLSNGHDKVIGCLLVYLFRLTFGYNMDFYVHSDFNTHDVYLLL